MNKLTFYIEKNSDGKFGLKVCDGEGYLYRYYASLSDNKESLEALVSKCREGMISRLHIDDVICDFLCQLSEV